MNCKPGDLAIVIGDVEDKVPPRTGAIVRISKASWFWPNAWELDPPVFDPADGAPIHVSDDCLRPIRDPGDDAQDETLSWLPGPSLKKELA